jgi:hypothetical protein
MWVSVSIHFHFCLPVLIGTRSAPCLIVYLLIRDGEIDVCASLLQPKMPNIPGMGIPNIPGMSGGGGDADKQECKQQ